MRFPLIYKNVTLNPNEAKNISVGLFILFLGSLYAWFIDQTIADIFTSAANNG